MQPSRNLMSRMLSIVVLVVILIAIGVIFFRVMSGFLVPVFFAALLGVIFQPLHERVDQRFGKQSRYVSAGITTLIAALAVVAPAALIITLGVFEGFSLADQVGNQTVRQRVKQLREQLALEIPLHEDLRKIESTLEYVDAAISRGESPRIEPATLENLSRRADR